MAIGGVFTPHPDEILAGGFELLGQGNEIAVAANDISVSHRNDISELPPHTTLEMQTFFEDYKNLEHGEVSVEEFHGRERAFEIVNEAIELYKETFGNKST